MLWLESNCLQVVVFKCHKVSTPSALYVLNEAIALDTKSIIYYDFMASPQNFRHR